MLAVEPLTFRVYALEEGTNLLASNSQGLCQEVNMHVPFAVDRGSVLAVCLAVLGCGDDIAGGGTGSSTGAGTESSGSSGAPTTGGMPESVPHDLFQCGLERDCLLSEHFNMVEPGMPSECAAQLIRSDKPGLMIVAPYRLPFCDDWSRLLLLRGDGTVIVQVSTAHEEDCEDHPDTFVAGPQQSCSLDLPDGFDQLDAWFPNVKDCVEGEFLTCTEAIELLDARVRLFNADERAQPAAAQES